MAEIQWYFPNELEDVPEILTQEGVIPHSGGTGILWGGMTRIRGLMDVSRLGLKFCRTQDGTIELGAVLSYGEAAAASAPRPPSRYETVFPWAAASPRFPTGRI